MALRGIGHPAGTIGTCHRPGPEPQRVADVRRWVADGMCVVRGWVSVPDVEWRDARTPDPLTPSVHAAEVTCNKKAARVTGRPLAGERKGYFFLALAAAAALRFSSIAAWAAARRATGTRNGEQLT